MSQKSSSQPLEQKRKQLLSRKKELESLKATGGEVFTDSMQEELSDIAIALVDLEEAAEPEVAETKVYMPEKGTEQMVHVQLSQGKRFNENTGKEISKVYTQLFTASEWRVFVKNYKRLGFRIIAILHNTTNEHPEIDT